ncbi:diguanylate cyclase [Anaerosporomusa subterranea]|uniref:Diguanylate cyclase n=1 Tax=Anaerosporomusa subterranea TaxID=1794912 RepID=A0A154BW57_ANASB|nr:GGDEF domain-containing protein [Anaerosporomusa subterranea]KYZ78263.1 diguanylate cyclase [Anaerosporomusa subterranea]
MLSGFDVDTTSNEWDFLCAELRDIINNRRIKTVFQPIVSLTDAVTLGYEALSRGPSGSPLEQPDRLFATATACDLLWELDLLCRFRALEMAGKIMEKHLLFLNVDPKIINDPRFQKGLTRGYLNSSQTDVLGIVFEITEKTAIQDYKGFRRILDNYTSQGYQIALDDTGSGYSGLTLLAETRPQYVKLDMELVRNIDKDSLKQALIKALSQFANATNIKLVAEGIETINELNTLIDIGVHYGQGFLLQRPSPDILELGSDIIQHIQERNDVKQRELFYSPLTAPIGEIARLDLPFSPQAAGQEIIKYFNNNPEILGIPIVDGDRPVGLLSKNEFLGRLATQYGVAVYMNRPVHLLMDNKPLIVDYKTPLDQVSKSAVARSDENMYDYIIVTKDNAYYGITTVKALLERTTQLELTRAKYSNPLTGLPGNFLIEQELKRVVAGEQDYAVLYFDLDNFKAYNDIYGFENGDKILFLTAKVIQALLNQRQQTDTFFGHIGGDDFVAVVRNENIAGLCEDIIEAFDQQVVECYSERDRNRGVIVSKNRHGFDEQFPLVAISIGVVTGKKNSFRNHFQLGEAASQVKKRCKLTWTSCYHIA